MLLNFLPKGSLDSIKIKYDDMVLLQRVVRMETSFEPLYGLFAPFFFVGIGLNIDPTSIIPGFTLGIALLVVAVVGKIVGAALPALASTGAAGAALIGVSMVPRAEIAMIVVQQGRSLGDWAVPANVYGGLPSLPHCRPVHLKPTAPRMANHP